MKDKAKMQILKQKMAKKRPEKSSRHGKSRLMTLREVAAYLGFHHLTVYRLIYQGMIPVVRLGGRWRFKKELLDAWIEENTVRMKRYYGMNHTSNNKGSHGAL